MNIFYTRAFDALPLTFARSASIRSEFARVQAGFDIVNPYTSELVDARLGQATLTDNLARYVTTFAPSPGHIDAGGYLVRNAGAPLLAGDLVSKAYADSLALSGIGPTMAGNAGKFLFTDGATASWQFATPALSISTTTSNALAAGQHLVLTNAALSTATLPATPAAGDTCWITAGNSRTDNLIARNGQNIMGIAEDLTIDSANATVPLRYINSTLGWRLV